MGDGKIFQYYLGVPDSCEEREDIINRDRTIRLRIERYFRLS